MTVTVIIGNTDNKLTQQQWSQFCDSMNCLLKSRCREVFFSAPSVGNHQWQNMCWVVAIDRNDLKGVKEVAADIGEEYSQDSVAWLECEKAQFV